MTAGVLNSVRSLARAAVVPHRLAVGGVGGLVLVQLLVGDQQAVENDQDGAEDGHRGERPAPAELDGERATEGDTEHRAERSAGHEGAGERGPAVGREHGEHDGQADAAVGGLADADEDAGEHQLAVVRRDGRPQRGQGPDRCHEHDRSTRPQRSPSSDSGTASRPTVSATTLVSAPSCVSVRAHSALRNGKTAESTCRDM